MCYFADKLKKETNETVRCPLCKVLLKPPWRNLHQEVLVDRCYYTPFVRMEKGGFRNKDVREIAPENNTVSWLIPSLSLPLLPNWNGWPVCL